MRTLFIVTTMQTAVENKVVLYKCIFLGHHPAVDAWSISSIGAVTLKSANYIRLHLFMSLGWYGYPS